MMSLDGYAAGPEQSGENPFGIGGCSWGGERLHATKRPNRCVDYDPGR
jgi:hypothetical protein